jgi:hypothetical protein
MGAERLGELELGQVGGKAQRHVLALAAEEVDQQAAAFERSRDLAEDHAGRVLVMQDQLGRHADVLFPGQAFDFAQFAELARLLRPFAQIAIENARFDIGPAVRARRAMAADGSAHPIGRFVLLGHH